ncbi:MAG: hypothetical protein AAGF88_12950 [Pseudomonadota bacterium]
MNSDDQTMKIVEDFLGEELYEYDAGDADLLDADWDGEDMFASLG